MITPSFGLTATERVLPRLSLDWTTGLAQAGVDVTRAGVATFVDSNGLIQSATANTQRIDYTTGVVGLLVEESRVNSFAYSSDFRNTASAGSTRPWINSEISSVASTTLAPDGVDVFQKLTENSANAAHLVNQSFAGNSAQVYSQTVFAKADERRYLRLTIQNVSVAADFVRAHFDLQTGTVLLSGVNGNGVLTSASIQNFGNGIYRCALVGSVGTVSASVSIRGSMQLLSSAVSLVAGGGYLGNGTSGLLCWGTQLEAGAFPTSYIPTTTTAVTRNADVASMTGTNFSDWFNATAGTFFIQTNARNGDALLTAGSYVLSADATALKKYASTYTSDPSATQLTFGKGTVQKVMYYPQALIPAEIAAITA